MSVAEFVASISWPLAILVIALLFRRPLADALGSASGTLGAGPFRLEWQRRAEAVEVDLSHLPPVWAGPDPAEAPSVSRREIKGAADRLDEMAQEHPTAAIVEAFGLVEIALRSLLEGDDYEIKDLPLGVAKLAELAQSRGLITAETRDAVDGLSVMRNLAAHGREQDLSPQRAAEFVTLCQGVLYAISANAKAARRDKK